MKHETTQDGMRLATVPYCIVPPLLLLPVLVYFYYYNYYSQRCAQTEMKLVLSMNRQCTQ